MFKKLYLLLAATCLIAVIINSCKKDAHTDQQNAVSDPAIAQAKSWYESTYPATNKLNTQTTTGNKDWSQLIKPDWQHTASYSRFNKQVIEMPVDPSAKFGSAIKNMTTGQITSKANSRSSYILLNDGSTYTAYIMTLIADSAWLKNDPVKLAHNTYNKRDANYSGLVLYFTPQGRYVGGWKYQDGKLVTPGKSNGNTTQKTQSIGDNKLNPQDMGEDCTDWYLVTYDNDIAIEWEYLYTSCRGTPGGGGGGSSGGGGAPTIPECPGTHSVKHPVVNNLPLPPDDGGSGGGGGFPPPPPSPQPSPCTVPDQIPLPDIIDSLTKKYPCTKALIAALPNLNTNIAQLIYQAFDSKDGNNMIFFEGDPAYFAANKQEDGHTEFDTRNGILTNRIYINPAVLANASNEYRIVTLYHEAIHAFLNYQHQVLGPGGFTANYPMINVVERPNFSQVVIQDKYDYYIDPAYQTKVVGKDHLTMADYFITGLKDAILAYNPSFPPERALALAQAGIIQNNGPIFVNYNEMERDITKGTSVGTKCTP